MTRRTERGSRTTNSLKTGPVKHAPHAGNLFQFGERELRLGQILLGHLAQAFLAQQAKMNGGGQRAQRLVGADVRGGLLAADVLFARRQRQAEAAPALGVGGLPGEPAGHLADDIFRAWRSRPA